MSNEKQQIEEMAKVLKDYTKKNNIMASHVILECYAEELYKAGFKRQSEARWVEESHLYVYCSNCRTVEHHREKNFRSKFCPNCGAKMKGENDGRT